MQSGTKCRDRTLSSTRTLAVSTLQLWEAKKMSKTRTNGKTLLPLSSSPILRPKTSSKMGSRASRRVFKMQALSRLATRSMMTRRSNKSSRHRRATLSSLEPLKRWLQTPSSRHMRPPLRTLMRASTRPSRSRHLIKLTRGKTTKIHRLRLNLQTRKPTPKINLSPLINQSNKSLCSFLVRMLRTWRTNR
jgi:hypothetical protein